MLKKILIPQISFMFVCFLFIRAALNISTEPIYKPGDLNWVFANIAEEFPHYGITVISTDPWIVTFDNFLTDEEVDAMISTNEGNYERSTDTGSVNE